jgi:flagellar protein FlaG
VDTIGTVAEEVSYQAEKQKTNTDSTISSIVDQWEIGSSVTRVETRITLDKSTSQMIVGVYNADTNELIREIPPEKVREMAENLLKLVGSQMDTRA